MQCLIFHFFLNFISGLLELNKANSKVRKEIGSDLFFCIYSISGIMAYKSKGIVSRL